MKLKHIDFIHEDGRVDVEELFHAIYGKKKTLIGNKWIQLRRLKEYSATLKEVMNTDLLQIKLKESMKLKLPKNIDSISFRAMTELRGYTEKSDRSHLSMFISNVICISIFSANTNVDYLSSGIQFKSLRSKILEIDLFEAFGMFNWINDQVAQSDKKWNERFSSVEIKDPNYVAAKGDRMHQFNTLNTLKSLCADFNVTMDKAWQIQYGVVMSNNYSKATRGHIQDGVRKLKEAEFEKKRKK